MTFREGRRVSPGAAASFPAKEGAGGSGEKRQGLVMLRGGEKFKSGLEFSLRPQHPSRTETFAAGGSRCYLNM